MHLFSRVTQHFTTNMQFLSQEPSDPRKDVMDLRTNLLVFAIPAGRGIRLYILPNSCGVLQTLEMFAFLRTFYSALRIFANLKNVARLQLFSQKMQ